MPDYKIAYIDEEPAEIRNFQRKMSREFEITDILPKQDLEIFVEELLSLDIDAYVIDFQLNEYQEDNPEPVNYNGSNLINKLLERRPKFPCFILTSHALAAVSDTRDVNYVYSKDSLRHDPQSREINFATRIRIQIEHYQSTIEETTARFHELVDKSNEQDLPQEEEDELLSLDSFLENVLDAKEALNPERKKEFVVGRIDLLIDKSEEIIDLLRKKAD